LKLARLIEKHRKALGPQDLSDNFGDGVLVQTNQLYAKIRAATLKLGYRYSSEPNIGYEALPFAQLEDILKNKRIPYTNNVTVVEKLVAQLKDDVVWDDVSDGLKKNYVFHESCHAVARSFPASREKSSSAKAFRMMMEESFANTCELLSVADAEDVSLRIFLELNSYTALFEEKTNLKNAIRQSGFETVFKVILLAYLFSNHLHERLDDKQWNRILSLVDASPLPAPQLKSLRALTKIAFTLDARFRSVTTQFHLKLNGINMSADQILKVDILTREGLSEFLQSSVRIVGGLA